MGSNWLGNISENPGLQIWRIDNKSQEISVVGSSTHGVFRSDDCYLVLLTALNENMEKRYELTVWVGKTTTQEDFANEKATELEAKLVNVARVREVQEHESPYFLGLFRFRGGLQYVEPVVLAGASNLRDDVHAVKLYHLKGRRNVRVKQVEVTHRSLNAGDVFVLDANDKIFQWNGSKAGRMEKAKALDLTVRLRDERMNRLNAKVVILEEGSEDEAFWTHLGGKGAVASAEEGGDDAEFEKASVDEIKLYRVEKDGDAFKHTQVDAQGKPLHRDMLDTNATFIVDAQTELFVWTGRNSAPSVREKAMSIATSFLKDHGRPNWTPITKVTEGVENALFKGKFHGVFKEFVDNPEQLASRVKKINKTAGTVRQETINVDAMHNPEKYALAREENISDKVIPSKNAEDEGELTIWYVKKNEKHALPLEEYGIFYSGESYLVQYSVHLRSGGYRHVVYYWQGRQSSTEDQGTCALLATNLANSLGRSVTQVRVTQNKEPDHFLAHFEGYMSVRRGARDSWAAEWQDKAQLFHVRGTSAVNTRAAQMKTVAASLNSNDAFLLKTPTAAWVWLGKGANEFERSVAVTLSERLLAGQSCTSVEEGSEPEAFWSALGGKGEYSNDPRLQSGDVKARLFQCSDATSVFKVLEIHDFVQDDLDNDDVMILDGYSEVFVWIGTGSTEREKAMGVQVAHDYLKAAHDGRPAHVPIYTVFAKDEPPQFSIYFLGWDEAAAKSGEDAYIRSLNRMAQGGYLQMSTVATAEVAAVKKAKEDYHAATKEGEAAPSAASSAPAPAAASAPASGAIYSFDRLKVKPTPEDVDPEHLERHLSAAEFQQFFKVAPEVFAGYPKWKQLRIKKDVGLF
jgi:hypothetical protein